MRARAQRLRLLREFTRWVVSLDEPGNTDRATVTLNQIINAARTALAEDELPFPIGQLLADIDDTPGPDMRLVSIDGPLAVVKHAEAGAVRRLSVQELLRRYRAIEG